MKLSDAFPLFSLLSLTQALPAADHSHSLPLPVDIIHQFPYPTWVQDLAVRECGKILVTLLTTPDLYEIDPLNGDHEPTLIHTFPEHLGLNGITELFPDIFYVAGGNVSILAAAGSATSTNFTLGDGDVPGAWDVYKVDLTKGDAGAKVDKVAHFPQALDLDGMTPLDAQNILISDSVAGLIYKLNVETGVVTTVIDDPALKGLPAIVIGVHKLRIRGSTLYFDNSGAETFAKIPIHADGTAAGPAVIISTGINSNGFDFDPKGDAFFTENTPNALGYVPVQGGQQTILAGVPLENASQLPGPQSCQFGRTPFDFETLYLTTTGGLASDQSLKVGGTLSKVNIGQSGYYNKGS
ncbi:hypothetical protein P7C71_g3555, partial [Lecanoromycetidae sp. Uapishka_2]